jgi:hypothetical protein
MSATTERAESNFIVGDESAATKYSELHLVDPISNNAKLGEAAQCRKTAHVDQQRRRCAMLSGSAAEDSGSISNLRL